jgi:acetamidase/formamidase
MLDPISLSERPAPMNRPMRRKSVATISALAAFVSVASAQPSPPGNKPDVMLGSTPDTVVWGYISSRTPPVLRIKSGTTVRIDTMSHQGLLTDTDPVTYFSRAGIKPEEVLQDAKDIYAKVPRGKGLGVHVLTGPIYIEGAEPGDALEVRVLDLEFRVPYGVNNTGPGSGVLPDLVPTPSPRVIKTDPQRKVALLPGGIELPLRPFLGIMAVAPPSDLIIVSSGPPNKWAGNLDLKVLGVGSTLYIPVFNEGGLFFTGDPHGVQGDGEVDGGALEQSLTGTLQFILHKGAGKAMRWPRAEDAANYYTLGLDVDLNIAMKEAVRETVALLQAKAGVTAAEAYAIASMGVDFRVAEAVDSMLLVYGVVPKKFFKQNSEYWGSK